MQPIAACRGLIEHRELVDRQGIAVAGKIDGLDAVDSPGKLAVVATGIAAGQTRLGFRGFLGLVPVPALILLAVIFLYALVNLLMLTPLSGVGDPVIRDGRFLFNDHGVVREMSEGQFHFQRSVSLRLFSSVWLFLYLFAAVYLLGARPSPNELER